MKILFFSDIHGIAANLEKLYKHADTLKPDCMALLGDALYHGPRNGVPDQYDPNPVADLLNSRKDQIVAVRGNCDSEVDQMLLEFPIMADFTQIITENKRFFLTHGHIWNEARQPSVPAGTVIAHGHTHIPVNKQLENGLTIFNPGSISLPKNGHPKTFGFFDGSELTVRLLDDAKIYPI